MSKLKRTIVSTFLILTSFVLGTSTAFAYSIWYNGGFDPVPTTIHCHEDFMSESKTAVSNACSAWNGAGAGNLISKGSDHSNTTYQDKNDSNEITKGGRGTYTYLMPCNTKIIGVAYMVS